MRKALDQIDDGARPLEVLRKGDSIYINVTSLETRLTAPNSRQIKEDDLLFCFTAIETPKALKAIRPDGFEIIVKHVDDSKKQAANRIKKLYADARNLHDRIRCAPPYIR